MTLAALMVDVDGVIAIAPDGRRWDADMEADLGVAISDLQTHFFEQHFRDCALGKADLAHRLSVALAKVAPTVGAEQLIAYWMQKDARLDQGLIADLARVRAGGLPMYLATVQEHRRAAYLMETLKLGDLFDGCFHSARMGAAKPDRAYFDAVAHEVGAGPERLLLIDDSARNVEAAREAGWRAEVWITGHSGLDEILKAHGHP